MGRNLGSGVFLGVGVGLGVTVGVELGVAVGLGVALGVGQGQLAVGVGDGVGVGVPVTGAGIATDTLPRILKNPTAVTVVLGGWSASNRKLYNVPQRIALALGFCAKVSVLHVIPLPPWLTSHGALLYPVSPCVPSWGQPGCWGGA